MLSSFCINSFGKELTITILILNCFWNPSNTETTLVKIPLVLNTEEPGSILPLL